MRRQPVVLVAAECRAVVHADVHPTVIAENHCRCSRGLECGGMMVSVRIWQRRVQRARRTDLAVQPPRHDRPVGPSICCSRRPEIAADPHGVPRRITWIEENHLVVPALPVADVHVVHGGSAGHRICWDLGRIDAVRDPGLSPVRGAVDVLHRRLCNRARVRVDDVIPRNSDAQRRAAVASEDVAGICNGCPGCSAIHGEEERRWLSTDNADSRCGTRLRGNEPSRAAARDAPNRQTVERRNGGIRRSLISRPIQAVFRRHQDDVAICAGVDLDLANRNRVAELDQRAPVHAAVLRLHHRATDEDLIEKIAETEVERVRIAAESDRSAAGSRQVVRQGRPLRVGCRPVVRPPKTAAGSQKVDDVRVRGMRQDCARAPAVAYVTSETTVLLVVATSRSDVDPFGAGRILLVRMVFAFLHGVRTECRSDDTPRPTLPREASRRIILLGTSRFRVRLFLERPHEAGRVIDRPFFFLRSSPRTDDRGRERDDERESWLAPRQCPHRIPLNLFFCCDPFTPPVQRHALPPVC